MTKKICEFCGSVLPFKNKMFCNKICQIDFIRIRTCCYCGERKEKDGDCTKKCKINRIVWEIQRCENMIDKLKYEKSLLEGKIEGLQKK